MPVISGGVFSIRISWDCNFDRDPKECKPKYDFDRLDKGMCRVEDKLNIFSWLNYFM